MSNAQDNRIYREPSDEPFPPPAPVAPPAPAVPHVLIAINAVTEEIASKGIAKAQRNQQQGFNFRGIDDIYNALAAVLARNKLMLLPRTLEHSQVERQTKSGSALFYTFLKMEFDFTSAVDGSVKTIGPIFGEAMDSADKGTNKAMSAAVKYACIIAFSIPTAGDNDPDATSHDVAARSREVPKFDITPWSKKISGAQSKGDFDAIKTELVTEDEAGKIPSAAAAEIKSLFAKRLREIAAVAKP